MAETSSPADSGEVDWPERLAERAASARHPLLKQFYETGCVMPDTPLANVPLLALDFETTGLEASQHGIVSVGLVPFTLAGIRCSEARHWIVKPRLPLEQTSVTIHGITHSDVAQAPDLETILPELLELMAGRIVVVHFKAIERPFLDGALKERLGEGITFPVIDTLAIEAHLHPERNPGLLARMMGRKPVSIRLADSRTRYRLPHYSPHHALTDAIACAELLQAQIQHHFDPHVAVGDLWL